MLVGIAVMFVVIEFCDGATLVDVLLLLKWLEIMDKSLAAFCGSLLMALYTCWANCGRVCERTDNMACNVGCVAVPNTFAF